MEFKTELKTKDGKVVPKESIWKPQEAACQLMADAIRRKYLKEVTKHKKLGRDFVRRTAIILCMCLLASGCVPRTVIEDADPTEPEIMLTLAEEPAPVDYQVCAQITPAAQAKTYRDIPLSHELQDIADKACEDYKIPQDVLYAVMKVESGYEVDAQNGSCYGLMQIHAINMEYLSNNIGTTDLTDPEQNIQAGHLSLVAISKSTACQTV